MDLGSWHFCIDEWITMGLPIIHMQHCNLSTDYVCRVSSETTWHVHFHIALSPEKGEL